MSGFPPIRLNTCGVVYCEPDWSWRPRLVDFDLWYIWCGRGCMRADGVDVPLYPGMIFCLRPGGDYYGTHDPRRRLGVCYAHFDFLDGRGRPVVPAAKKLPPLYCELEQTDVYESILRRVAQLRQSPVPAARRQAELLAAAVIEEIRHRAAAPPLDWRGLEQRRMIEQVTRELRENPGRTVRIADLAGRVGYGPDHFTRLFKATMGVAPKEFALRVRSDRARHLLRETPMSVERIARNLGYSDVFEFSRQFKLRTGQSPRRYRIGQASG